MTTFVPQIVAPFSSNSPPLFFCTQKRRDESGERKHVSRGDHADECERDGAAPANLLEAMPGHRPGKWKQQRRLGDGRDQPDPPREPDELPATPKAHQRERDL